jgi:hypothetical protein
MKLIGIQFHNSMLNVRSWGSPIKHAVADSPTSATRLSEDTRLGLILSLITVLPGFCASGIQPVLAQIAGKWLFAERRLFRYWPDFERSGLDLEGSPETGLAARRD